MALFSLRLEVASHCKFVMDIALSLAYEGVQQKAWAHLPIGVLTFHLLGLQ